MPQIEIGDNGNFIIDGDRRQRGNYDYIFLGNDVLEVFPVHDTKERSYKGKFPEEWTKAGGISFTDKADFVSYIDSFFFFIATGGTAPPPSGGEPSDGDKVDIAVSGAGLVWEIKPNVVDNTNLSDMATNTIKGRSTGTGDPEDLTPAQVRTIINVEDGADVTDEANVTSSLSGATITGVVVDGTDKVLIQDTSDTNNLKTVTAQSIADLGTGATDLTEGTATTTTVVIESSTGNDATLQSASTLRAGLMSKSKFDEVELNNAKVTNVDTDLSIGSKTATTLDIVSSDGTDATVPQATIAEAGLMSAADKVKLDGITDTDDQTASEVIYDNNTSGLTATDVQDAIDEIELRVDVNDGKVSNVTTNLSEGTVTNTTVDVNSSDGANATLIEASTSRAGVLSKAKFDEIVANTAKVTNVTTDLGVANNTTTTLDVTSSDGTDATLPQATASLAGLMSAADKTKLDAPNKYVTSLSSIVINTPYLITHNLNDAFFIVQLWDDATDESIIANLSLRTANTVTVTFINEAPTGTVQVIVKI